MTKVPISKTKIETKLAIIREALTELEQLAKIEKDQFLSDKKNFAIAEHYLRRTLEAVFDIAGHIISRYPMSPGKRPTTYKDLAISLAEKNIVDDDFGKNILTKMAGYRNRMVHFYDEITSEEMYQILQEKLTEIDRYAIAVVNVLKNPEKFDLIVDNN
jgi:uncharacterized protein YutE (UPF0331/DUF86 family)